MTTGPGFVIVGASLAGAKAAQTLREEGYSGPLTLVGDDDERPYERPPLSKDYLQGASPREKVFVHPEGWYAEHDVDLRLGTTVTAIDRDRRQVTVADGDPVPYAKVLVTTGSSPRRLQVPGADLAGVHYLRTLADSDEIRKAFASAGSVAVVGGGWIGLETAAAARGMGLDVTVLEYAELPLLRVLGRAAAGIFAGLHRDHGVDLRVGVEVAGLTGDDAGRVSGVRLGDGSTVDADLVLVGVGITPNTGLASAAGLDVDNGILVDARLATSDPDVFAAGDVANAFHPLLGRRIRVEHWANARRQGVAAGRSMLGQPVSYDRMPYFFSDQYDLGMEYTGYVDLDDGTPVDFVVRGDLEGRELIGFWVSQGRVLAGMNVNVWDVTEAIEGLVRSGREVDRDRLVDLDVPLDEL